MKTSMTEGEKYRVVAPEAMHETFMSDSEEEGGEFLAVTAGKFDNNSGDFFCLYACT